MMTCSLHKKYRNHCIIVKKKRCKLRKCSNYSTSQNNWRQPCKNSFICKTKRHVRQYNNMKIRSYIKNKIFLSDNIKKQRYCKYLLKRYFDSNLHRKYLKINRLNDNNNNNNNKRSLQSNDNVLSLQQQQTDFVQNVNKKSSQTEENFIYNNNNNDQMNFYFISLDSLLQLDKSKFDTFHFIHNYISHLSILSEKFVFSKTANYYYNKLVKKISVLYFKKLLQQFSTIIFKLFFIACIFNIILARCHLVVAAAEQKDLNLNFEQSIAAVFNKVAYGSSTTKRSIPDNWSLPHFSTIATPILTTYQYRDGDDQWFRVDEVMPTHNEKIGPKRKEPIDGDTDIVKERRHQHKSHHHNPDIIAYEHDLEKDHVLPTSAPNADILKGNTNKHYNNPNRYANDRAKHNLQVFGQNSHNNVDIDRIRDTGIRTYPETRRPSSLLETDSGKIASTQSSYNLLRNINPTPPMHRGGDFPSYSPPTRSHFTPPLPPEYGNPFADKPTLKGTNSGTNNYQNRRPIPPPSIMPKHDRIPFRPDLPQIGLNSSVKNNTSQIGKTSETSTETRKIFSGNSPENNGKKKVLNTPSLNTDKFGDFLPHTPVNESQFEYDQKSMIPSISRILSGSNGRKDPISDVLLRTVTEKPSYQHAMVTRYPPTQSQETTKKLHENTSKPKFVEDIDEEPFPNKEENIQSHVISDDKSGGAASTTLPNPNDPDETTMNIENEFQNLPNINRNKNNFQIYSTKTTYFNATNRDNFYTWHVSWNLHVYLTAILYTLLAVYSIYKIIRFDKLTHLFNQGYFIIVHLLLTTICVSRIFYLIYDPYNINLTFPKFISDILLNLPLSLLAIAFATLICYLLKRTLNKTNFKVKPIFVIIFSFLHIFLCISLHLLENFDLLGKNNILSLVCQFIYVLLCLFLGFSYLYLYKVIKKVLSKKSQNFSELSVQNLSYATHITIAAALLFVLMSILQIYGIFGIRSHERFSNIPPFKWLAWGFQFSIRLIEISIIALLSWVVSLKLSIREKNIDNNISSGFALFPCANSNSTVDNEIYPAICQTNQNVHNFTLRSGKSLYDDNYPLGNMDGIPNEIIGRPNLGAVTNGPENSNFERTGSSFERSSKNNFDQRSSSAMHNYPECHHMNNFEHSKANNFERSNYERSSGNIKMAPVHNFDRNVDRVGHYTSRGDLSQEVNCFDNRYLEDTPHNVEDHYENPDLELESLTRKSKRVYEKYNHTDNSDACSVNSYHSNSVMGGAQKRSYITNPDNDQGVYNEPVDQAEYGFQKYERSNFERPNSRTNSSYSSKHLNRSDKRSNSSSSGNSGTFERRSMRKSGTLNDFGNKRGGVEHGSSHGFRNGIQTLNSAQKVHSYGKSSGQRIVNLNDDLSDSMLVDENGFVRFRNMGTENKKLERSRRSESKNREHKNKNVFNT